MEGIGGHHEMIDFFPITFGGLNDNTCMDSSVWILDPSGGNCLGRTGSVVLNEVYYWVCSITQLEIWDDVISSSSFMGYPELFVCSY